MLIMLFQKNLPHRMEFDWIYQQFTSLHITKPILNMAFQSYPFENAFFLVTVEVHCMKSRAHLSWNFDLPLGTHVTDGWGSFTGHDNFLERDFLSFGPVFFFLHVFTFFSVFSSFSIIYFCHCFSFIFIFDLFYNFLFSTYLFFSFAFRTSLAPTSNNKPRAAKRFTCLKLIKYKTHLVIWSIFMILNILHIHRFKFIKILTRRSKENQAFVFEHVKQNTCI